jgi:hypothetical protein
MKLRVLTHKMQQTTLVTLDMAMYWFFYDIVDELRRVQ